MLDGVRLFDGLSSRSKKTLEKVATPRNLEAGETLVEEGQPSTTLFVVVKGRLEVVKTIRGSAHAHRIHELGLLEPVGEVGFFDRKPRSATVRALEKTLVLGLPYDAIEEEPEVVRRLGEHLAERIRSSNDDELDAAHRRVSMGMLVVKIIMLLCGYALLLAALPGLDLGSKSTTYLSLPIVAAFGIGAWRFIRKTGSPLSMFGLGFENSIMSLVEAVIFTPPFLALLVALKWIAMKVNPDWRALPLFERTDVVARLTEPNVVKLLVIYFVSSTVQELIVRSALQSSLEEFLIGPNRRSETLVVCALMFAVNHLHISFLFAAFAFIPGLLWGWLFMRRRHIIGPAISHFVVGAFVFFILGVSLP